MSAADGVPISLAFRKYDNNPKFSKSLQSIGIKGLRCFSKLLDEIGEIGVAGIHKIKKNKNKIQATATHTEHKTLNLVLKKSSSVSL